MRLSMLLVSLIAATMHLSFVPQESDRTQWITDAPDALSVALPTAEATARVQYAIDGEWGAWQTLQVENEQDPLLLESNLVLFPKGIDEVRIEGEVAAIHPILVSEEPVHFTIAGESVGTHPRILSREEWGANENLLLASAESSSANTEPETRENGNGNSAEVPARVTECEEAQRLYKREFRTIDRQSTDSEGRKYRWARDYSPEVRLLVVHHTAMKVTGDARSGAERVRALYEYHAKNRGWGDIGYHYLIDETGQIYEGKSGGKGVVGGHAYCHNIGSIGIALLGNFEEEKPTQEQLKSLQWLLRDLADTYEIDLDRSVSFHGKTLPPIVGHRDLLSTDCPGYYVAGSMSQIRTHVAGNELTASVTLPPTLKKPTIAKSTTKKVRKATPQSRRASRAKASLPRRVQRALNRTSSRVFVRSLRDRAASDRPAVLPATTRTRRPTIKRSTQASGSLIRIRLTKREMGMMDCSMVDLSTLSEQYRGTLDCMEMDGRAAIINTLPLEDYLKGLAEEPDTEPYEKQRAFAIAARTYAAWYMDPAHRKFPGMPYDGSDDPAAFQAYGGRAFEAANPRWLDAVHSTAHLTLHIDGSVIKPPYFSSDDGRTRTPEEAGWKNFPHAEVFSSKADPWCEGMPLRGHGVGMSGCGAEGQAKEGKTAEDILQYYYPGTQLLPVEE